MNTQPEIGATAPSFSLADTAGNPVVLSSYREQKTVLLVLNRGFN